MSTWIETTSSRPWERRGDLRGGAESSHGITLTGQRQQRVSGFGGCFNELGYLPLSALDEALQEEVLHDLFSPEECNLSVNRAPIGANDFSRTWYSYDEVEGDYDLDHFSVEHDDATLVPYIRAAMRHQPNMRLFSSPWSPPTWMKDPPVYNHGRLIMTDKNLDAYARYFVRYVQEYARRGITVDQVHVQNEVFADQKFPSCVFTSEQLRVFIRDHLGPRFEESGLDTKIFLGTLNGPEDATFTPGFDIVTSNYNRYVDNILFDEEARRHIAGVGYQWAGQGAIQRTHESWPELELMQTESECGMGTNDWDYAEYVFHLIQHYFRNGVSSYTYWNMILAPGGNSSWGWHQNSMLTIDPDRATVVRNPEYWVMKHYSHFVRAGAVRLGIRGHFSSMSSVFENPDGSLVIVVQNALDRGEDFSLEIPHDESRCFTARLAPRSFNTFVV
jgi:glucosylceramidase